MVEWVFAVWACFGSVILPGFFPFCFLGNDRCRGFCGFHFSGAISSGIHNPTLESGEPSTARSLDGASDCSLRPVYSGSLDSIRPSLVP